MLAIKFEYSKNALKKAIPSTESQKYRNANRHVSAPLYVPEATQLANWLEMYQ